MKNNEENVREIDLSSLLSLIVRKAVCVLLVGVILAGCLAAYQVSKQKKAVAESEAAYDEKEQEKLDQDYEKALAKYQKKCRDAELELAQANEQLDGTKRYLQNSLKMNLDAYDYYTTTIFISVVNVDEQIANEVLGETTNLRDYIYNKISDRYVMLTTGLDFAADLGIAKYETTSDKYVRELVSVTNYGSGAIRIVASEATEEDANALAMALYNFIIAQNATVANALYTHDLTLDSCVTKNVVDDELAQSQQEYGDTVRELEYEIEDSEAELEDLAEPNKADYKYEYELYVFSKAAVIKSAILGFIAGVFCSAAIVIIDALLRKKFSSTYDMERETQMKYLGSAAKKDGLFVRTAAGIASDRVWKKGTAEAYLKAQTAEAVKEKEQILIASSVKVPEKAACQLKALFEAEGCGKAVVVDRFLENAAAVEALAACDCVILAERISRSSSPKVERTTTALKGSGKDVIGFVTI